MNSLVYFIFLLSALAGASQADFVFERLPVSCEFPCDHGGCQFSGCTKPTSCGGGACLFINCHMPTCVGGACEFDNCYKPTCNGGGCSFINQKHTITAEACTGESCTLDGVPLPVLHRNEFLTV